MNKTLVFLSLLLIFIIGCEEAQEYVNECSTDEDCDDLCEQYKSEGGHYMKTPNMEITDCTCEYFPITSNSYCIPHRNQSILQVKITSNIGDTNITNITITGDEKLIG